MSPDAPTATIYSAPRRFDLATIMVVTLAYALLLAGLRLLRMPPSGVLHVAGCITCVGIGQALLFRGKRPRLSSILVGVAYLVGSYVIDAVTRDGSLLDPRFFVQIWLSIGMAGVVVGYLSGIAVGSVFLFSDVARKAIQRFKRR